jgi:hypothetical protein
VRFSEGLREQDLSCVKIAVFLSVNPDRGSLDAEVRVLSLAHVSSLTPSLRAANVRSVGLATHILERELTLSVRRSRGAGSRNEAEDAHLIFSTCQMNQIPIATKPTIVMMAEMVT